MFVSFALSQTHSRQNEEDARKRNYAWEYYDELLHVTKETVACSNGGFRLHASFETRLAGISFNGGDVQVL